MNREKHANQSKAKLAKEIGNSLNSIRSTLDIWFSRDPVAMDDLRHSLEMHFRELTRLSDDLLESAMYAKIRFTLRYYPAMLQHVMANAIEHVRPLMERRSQTLRLAEPFHPIYVKRSAERLNVVLVGLLLNASRSVPQHGTIFVFLRCNKLVAELRISDRENGWPVDVPGAAQDNGTQSLKKSGQIDLVPASGNSPAGSNMGEGGWELAEAATRLRTELVPGLDFELRLYVSSPPLLKHELV